MSPRPVVSGLAAAGARRAPAAFAGLALVLVASSAGAHGPLRRQPVTKPPAGVEIPPGPALDPTVLQGSKAAPSGAVPTTGVVPLRSLGAESTAVVEAVVLKTTPFDDDKLRVYQVRVERTLHGTLEGDEVDLVEIRGAASRPGFVADGERAILVLRTAPRLSYLTQQLPAGTYYSPSGGRDGVIPITSDAERDAVARALDEGFRISTLTDETENRRARRALAFEELGSMVPRLAADALVELRRLDPLAPLSHDELGALERTFAAKSIPPATRVGLAQLVAQRGLTDAVPALRAALLDTPEVFDAVFAARTRLGAPPDRAELASYLTAKDPAVRASAIRALAELKEPAVGEIGRYATSDPDLEVRVAAIEALGATQQPAALPTLSQTFGTSQREIRQASGRAILAIGGDPASQALINLALHGEDADTRSYAALLLMVSNGRDSAPVQRLLASNPSSEVRNVIEHGLRWTHSHQHDE
ncbi:MAG TPA: HEAT repeat domain-containing protein [Candidatus Eisenbacteria bacterium]|nr:HEAT repeat domain-containing protein [Candidatus Eisenbacteria bacterium]